VSPDRRLESSLGSDHGKLRVFGPFDLMEELGRGSYGVVYKARHRAKDQLVALKVLQGVSALDPRDVKRFERESGVLAKLYHPSIVRVVDSGTSNGFPWVALELVDGRPLTGMRLGLAEHVALLARVARAVGAAHHAHIVHRDLKPANILVDARSGEPKVLDFGLAFDSRFDATRLSRTGEVQGTPAYITPEAVRGVAAPDDPRRDIYALGIMLYERLAGEHPFWTMGQSAVEVVARTLKGAPSLVGRRGVDRELARICERACALDPAKRHPDGDALALELEAWVARHPGGSAEGAGGRSLVLPVVLAGLALVLVAVVVLLVTRKSAPPPPPPVPPPVERPPPPPARPVPPPEEERHASEDELAPLEGGLERAFFHKGPFEDFREIAHELARKYPRDRRVRFFELLARAFEPGREFEVRRDLVRLARERPALPSVDLVALSLFYRTTGFDRAACCVGEDEFPDEGTRPILLTNFEMHFHMLADDPVRDAERADRLADLLLSKKTLADAHDYPERYLCRLAKGDAALGVGDFERAARELDEAANDLVGEDGAFFRREARAARQGEKTRESMGQHFVATLGVSEFLDVLTRHESAGLHEEAYPHARALAEIGEREATEGRPEHSALARLRAARLLRRFGKPAEGRAALEAAARLALPAIDMRSLIERALANDLLVDEPRDPARAAELALEAAKPADGEFDPRTPCEVADAWALVARARVELHDEKGARDALARARELKPRDRRELGLVEALLGR
jgi:serine/threonine protein kinase